MKYDDKHWLGVWDEWYGRLRLAADADNTDKHISMMGFETVNESRILPQSEWDEKLQADLRFLRGGVVKNIYDDKNKYPHGSRYTFRVAQYWDIHWPNAHGPWWSIRILTHEECNALGFDSVTGESATYPYINVGGNSEYQAIKQSWEEEQHRRREWAMQNAENFRSNNHWKQVYNLYLKSPEWRIFRWSVRKHYNFTCQRCGIMPSSRDQHVHHLHYETAGAESFDDVTLLCRACHELEHDITEPAS